MGEKKQAADKCLVCYLLYHKVEMIGVRGGQTGEEARLQYAPSYLVFYFFFSFRERERERESIHGSRGGGRGRES